MTYTVYDALLTFRENIGEYNIVIEEMGQDSLLMKLKGGEVDLAFSVFREEELENKCNNLGIDYENIYRGHVCACVNSSHSLTQRGIVTPDDLRMEKLVMYNPNYIKDFYRKYLNGNEILLISNNSELLRLSVFINVNTNMYTFACIRMYKTTHFPSLNDSLNGMNLLRL
jgi:LysR family transcriptional regulator, transcription activator of glutamate synthase operon